MYLVRHGATDANLQRPYVLQGRGIDHALSETGRLQASAVAEFLSRFQIHRAFSSGMKRAIETAGMIAQHHNLDVTPIETLGEVDVGDWEGMSWEAIMQEYPEEYRRFMEDPATHPYVGGESYGDVHRRVRPVIQQLLEEHAGQNVLVVAHNVVNRVILADLLGMEIRRAKDIKQANTGVNVIRHRDGETELLTLNAQFHLLGG
ncbi:MAG: alpha-ribazole phosphatase [Planctomycetaceae bacterium]